MKTIIMADILAICFAAGTEMVDGWSKLSAIGVLGALLAIMLYRFPETVTKITEPHRQNFDRLEKAHKETAAEIKEAIELQTVVAEEHARRIQTQQEEYQAKHLQLLTQVLNSRDQVS